MNLDLRVKAPHLRIVRIFREVSQFLRRQGPSVPPSCWKSSLPWVCSGRVPIRASCASRSVWPVCPCGNGQSGWGALSCVVRPARRVTGMWWSPTSRARRGDTLRLAPGCQMSAPPTRCHEAIFSGLVSEVTLALTIRQGPETRGMCTVRIESCSPYSMEWLLTVR